MQLLTIRNDTGIDDIEKQYRTLQSFSEVEARVDVMVPKKLDNNFMGLVPALIQFVITWVRYPNSGKLLLDVLDPKSEDWYVVFESEHIYPIVALVINKTGIYNSTGEIALNDFLREPFTLIRKNMVKVNAWKGSKLMLTSVDHFPEAHGLLPCFETPFDFINNEKTISNNLKPALDTILRYSKKVQDSFEPVEKDFFAIIHELMKNTWEWGKADDNNVALDPSIRGVLIKFYRRKRDVYLSEFKYHKGAREYFENPRIKENSLKELYFLEISVFDSGVGFVTKYRGPRSEKLSDVDIIKQCLIKHNTSAKGLEKSEKGIGLDRILKILSSKGFLRIKTNNSCVYRNLITHPYKSTASENDMDLFDWEQQSLKSYTNLPNAQGSVLTILYPLAINAHK